MAWTETPIGEALLEGLCEAAAWKRGEIALLRNVPSLTAERVNRKSVAKDFARIFPPLRHPCPHSGRLGARPPLARPSRERATPGDRAKSEGGGGGGGRGVGGQAGRGHACTNARTRPPIVDTSLAPNLPATRTMRAGSRQAIFVGRTTEGAPSPARARSEIAKS